MKKTVYIQLVGKRSKYGLKRIEDVTIEGTYVKKPAASKPGVTVELELDLDPALFEPVAPKVEVTLERSDDDDALVVVTGTRTKSQAAKALGA